MSDPAPILDYASPQRRRRLALPVDTQLYLTADTDQVTAVASVRARAGAIGAMLFAVFILCLYGWMIFTVWRQRMGGVPIIMLFWLGYASLFVLVIHNTWRSTTLTADANYVKLTFSAPWSSKTFEWTADQIAQIEVVPVLFVSGSLYDGGELFIAIRQHPPLRLFGGHRIDQISQVSRELRRVLNLS